MKRSGHGSVSHIVLKSIFVAFPAALALACGGGGDSGGPASGGSAFGGAGSNQSGGASQGGSGASQNGGSFSSGGMQSGTGGSAPSGGGFQGGSSSGGNSFGGKSFGGNSFGGNVASGGSGTTGGVAASGGVPNGGTSSGGSAQGGGGAQGGGAAQGGAAQGGAAQGGSGAGGASSGGSGGGAARFSFFMTSQAGLFKLAREFNGSNEGFGGDLRYGKADGLSGADEICKKLAETSMPNNGKTWRAFLSVTAGPDGKPVNAIDRVGEGPWYDRKARLFAMNKAALLSERPMGIDQVIRDDFPNEEGVLNHNPGTGIIDNHNVLTGSTTSGTIDNQGKQATCQDWTSSQSTGGRPRCGVSWPRASLKHWISVLNEGGCAPGATPGNDAQSGPSGTVGALGGYGGFYCFALTP